MRRDQPADAALASIRNSAHVVFEYTGVKLVMQKFKKIIFISTVLLLLLGTGAYLLLRNVLNNQILKTVSVVRSHMRSCGTAIEAYRNDHQTYPPYTLDPSQLTDYIPTFMRYLSGASATLTTPVAYITNYPRDPFSQSDLNQFAYYAPDGGMNGWVLFSPGPDLKFDLDWAAYVHDPATNKPSAESMAAMINSIYDPTNGAISHGDIVRFKM